MDQKVNWYLLRLLILFIVKYIPSLILYIFEFSLLLDILVVDPLKKKVKDGSATPAPFIVLVCCLVGNISNIMTHHYMERLLHSFHAWDRQKWKILFIDCYVYRNIQIQTLKSTITFQLKIYLFTCK